MIFVFKTRNCVPKTRKFVFNMINFAGKAGDPARLSRAELRLLFLIMASCVSPLSVYVVHGFGITQALVRVFNAKLIILIQNASFVTQSSHHFNANSSF